MSNGRIAGKRAIITGAGMGIGRATAIRFAREGARVGIIDINRAAAGEVVSQITTSGGAALPLVADVTDESQVAHAIEPAVTRWGGLDIVVPNAAVALMCREDRVTERK